MYEDTCSRALTAKLNCNDTTLQNTNLRDAFNESIDRTIDAGKLNADNDRGYLRTIYRNVDRLRISLSTSKVENQQHTMKPAHAVVVEQGGSESDKRKHLHIRVSKRHMCDKRNEEERTIEGINIHLRGGTSVGSQVNIVDEPKVFNKYLYGVLKKEKDFNYNYRIWRQLDKRVSRNTKSDYRISPSIFKLIILGLTNNMFHAYTAEAIFAIEKLLTEVLTPDLELMVLGLLTILDSQGVKKMVEILLLRKINFEGIKLKQIERTNKCLFINHKVIRRSQEFSEFYELFYGTDLLFKIIDYFNNDSKIFSAQDELDKFSWKVEQQGLFSGIRDIFKGKTFKMEINHKIDIPVLNEIRDLMNLPEASARSILSCCTLVTALSVATNWQQVICSLLQYVSGDRMAWQLVSRTLESIYNRVIALQGIGEIFDRISNDLQIFWELVVSSSVSMLVTQNFKMVNESFHDLLSTAVHENRKAIIREGSKTVALKVISWIKEVFNRVYDCYTIGSLEPLWGNTWNPEKWIKEGNSMKNFQSILTIQKESNPQILKQLSDLRSEGFIPSYWNVPVSSAEYFERFKNHQLQGEKLMNHFKSNSIIFNNLKKAFDEFQSTVEHLKIVELQSTERVVPYFIYIYGEPGVGKSFLANQISKAICQKNNFDAGPSSVYNWETCVNFQDGFTNRQVTVIMDDIDTTVSKPTAGIPTSCDQVIKLVNTLPFQIEKARIEDKGKYFASPLLLMYCSNHKGGNAQNLLSFPSAFYRRINYHLTITVKKEFQDSNGKLDINKAMDAKQHDMYEILVSKYSETGKSSSFLTNGENYSLPKLMILLQKDFREHLDRSVKLLSKRSLLGNFCNLCGLGKESDCGCEITQLQGSSIHSDEEEIVDKCSYLDSVIQETTTSDKFSRQELIKILVECWPEFDTEEYDDLEKLINFLKEKIDDNHIPTFYKFKFDEQRYKKLCSLKKDSDKSFCSRRRSIPLMMNTELMKWSCDILKQVGTSLAILLVLRKLYNIYESYNTIQNYQAREVSNSADMPSWFRPNEEIKPGFAYSPSTFTFDDLTKVLEDSHCMIEGPKSTLHGFILTQKTILTCSHVAKIGDIIKVKIANRIIEIKLTQFNVATLVSNPEIMIIATNNLKCSCGIFGKLLVGRDQNIAQFDSVLIYSDKREYSPNVNSIRSTADKYVLTTDAETRDGDCGLLYLVEHNKSWKIGAMHYAIDVRTTLIGTSSSSIGGLLFSNEISKIIDKFSGMDLQSSSLIRETMAKDYRHLELGKFGPKSEVFAAMSQGANPSVRGHLFPGLPGSTPKTKVRLSLLAPYLINLEEEICGMKDYFVLPEFRGQMIEGIWRSPFTNMWTTHNDKQLDYNIMLLCLADYLSGCDLLFLNGYYKISELQAIEGVQGTYVKPLNMRTSAGPPFCKNKRFFLVRDDDGYLVSPLICEQMDKIYEGLQKGIVQVQALCCLKDEPIKYNKIPRVFNNLPMAFNLVNKEFGSAWKNLFRANSEFFESTVGIDMTSSDSNRFINYLKTINPELDLIEEGDVKAFDKSWNGDIYELVAKVIYCLSFIVGVEPIINYNLIMSHRYLIYNIKNDLFEETWNPSGCDCTVEMNSIVVSLMDRYAYYSIRGHKVDLNKLYMWYENFFMNPVPNIDGLDYRVNNALQTYGDDMVVARRYPLENYCKVFRDEIGMIMTDSTKNPDIILRKPITETSFLKRTPIFDKELGFYKAAIDKKTIVRMLKFNKESTLTQPDHACIVATEALKESVLHGREFYDYMLNLLSPILIIDLKLVDNPYLELHDYDYWFKLIKENKFRTWSERRTPKLKDLKGEIILQGEEIDGDVTGFTTDQKDIVVGDVQQTLISTFEKSNVDVFVNRPVLIKTIELLSTDIDFSVISEFDPWEEILANAEVTQKLNNYTYMRSSIELTFKVTAPPGTFGMYTISALPNGGLAGSGAIAEDLNHVNALQTDINAIIDISSSKDIVLTLPYINPVEMSTISITGGTTLVKMWVVSLLCFLQVRSALGDTTPKVNIKIYCRIGDDYILSVPHFQAKKKKEKKIVKEESEEEESDWGSDRFYGDEVASPEPKEKEKVKEKVKEKSSMIKTIDKVTAVADIVSNVPVIGEAAKAISMAGSFASSFLSSLGFTRTLDETIPVSFSLKGVSNTAHFDGKDNSDSASLSTINQIGISPQLIGFGEEDCLSFAATFARDTLIGEVDWTTIQESLTDLASIPVTPFYCLTSTTIAGTVLHLNPGGFVGLPFSYWRGSITYTFIIPVSSVHRGTLQVYYNPINSSTVNDVTNLTYNNIFDISPGKSFSFTVGYAREKPFLNNIVLPATITDFSGVNGLISLRIINPLTAPLSTANTKIFIFMKCEGDMEFAVPRDELLYQNLAEEPTLFNLRTGIGLLSLFSNNNLIFDILIGPLIEETFKWYCGYSFMVYLFVIIEFFVYLFKFYFKEDFIEYIFILIRLCLVAIHLVIMQLPFVGALMLHITWNYLMCYYKKDDWLAMLRIVGDVPVAKEEINLVPIPGVFPSELGCFGEKINSVRALLQKPSQLKSVTCDNTTIILLQGDFVAPNNAVSNDFSSVFTYLGYYKTLYVGLAGSTRVKIFTSQPCFTSTALIKLQANSDNGDYIPTMGPMNYTGPLQGSETIVPYYFNQLYVQSWNDRGKNFRETRTIMIRVQVLGEGTTKIIPFISKGPDIRGTCFRQVPPVILLETPTTASVWF